MKLGFVSDIDLDGHTGTISDGGATSGWVEISGDISGSAGQSALAVRPGLGRRRHTGPFRHP
jgi:hypothetical protein